MRNLHVVTCPGCGETRELVRKLQGTYCRRCAADLTRQTPKVQPAGGWPDCIEWEGMRDRHGYGRKYIGDGKTAFAHRLAYAEAHGSITAGAVVRHRCDFPPCINPAHLLLGTQADNMADMAARARAARGTRKPNARLTPDIVQAIRAEHRAGAQQRALALKHGVGLTTVNAVIKGRSWAWLPEVAS